MTRPSSGEGVSLAADIPLPKSTFSTVVTSRDFEVRRRLSQLGAVGHITKQLWHPRAALGTVPTWEGHEPDLAPSQLGKVCEPPRSPSHRGRSASGNWQRPNLGEPASCNVGGRPTPHWERQRAAPGPSHREKVCDWHRSVPTWESLRPACPHLGNVGKPGLDRLNLGNSMSCDYHCPSLGRSSSRTWSPSYRGKVRDSLKRPNLGRSAGMGRRPWKRRLGAPDRLNLGNSMSCDYHCPSLGRSSSRTWSPSYRGKVRDSLKRPNLGRSAGMGRRPWKRRLGAPDRPNLGNSMSCGYHCPRLGRSSSRTWHRPTVGRSATP